MSDAQLSVSVIMTCYNEGRYIGEAVRSVLDQTRSDLIEKIVIADDGSAPDTIAVLKDIETWDPRIEVIYGPGGVGVPGQRNLAIARTSTPFFAILDGDDFWTPTKLELQLPILANHPEVGLIYADFYLFADGDVAGAQHVGVVDLSDAKDLVKAYFLNDPPIVPSTAIFRRSDYDAIGGFNAGVRVFEDTEICLRMAKQSRFAVIHEATLYKRVHNASITGGRKDLLAHHAYVAMMAAVEDLRLLKLVPQRLAVRAAKLANQRFMAGRREEAAAFAGYAFRLLPYSPRAWMALILASLPDSLASLLRRTVFAGRVRALKSLQSMTLTT